MAKSLRSKVKRDFRSKKRDAGVYAATEAARLHRLNAKLKSLVSTTEEGENPVEEEGGQEDLPGWSWFASFGLLDANDISVESMNSMENGSRKCRQRRWRRQAKSLRNNTISVVD